MARLKGPQELEKTALLDELSMPSMPILAGMAAGYSPGRNVARSISRRTASMGHKEKSERLANGLSSVGVPLGALAGLAVAHKYKLAPKLINHLERKVPGGLIAAPEIEREVIQYGAPFAAGVTGSIGGGLATGGLVGLAHKRRNPSVKTASILSSMCNELQKIADLKPSKEPERPDVKDEMKASVTPLQNLNEPTDQEYGDERDEVRAGRSYG